MSSDVGSTLASWSDSEASNLPAGTTAISSNLDDNLRQIQAVVRAGLAHKGSDIVAAGTTDIGAVSGFYHDITGATTVTGLGTISAGIGKVLQFDSTPVLKYNATSLILPGNADITAAAGDHLYAISLGSGNWMVPWYVRDSGLPLFADFPDSFFRVVGSSDATKKVAFEVDGLTTATTRTVTVPDADLTLVGVATSQTLTGKTMTAPVLTSPVINTAVTGTAMASQAQQETGTATDVLVAPGVQHFHPSACKGWVNFDNAGTVFASYNCASVSDGGTGDFTVNWATDLSSANYCVIVSARRSDDSFICAYIGATVSGAQTKIKSADAAGNLKDADNYYVAVFGDV